MPPSPQVVTPRIVALQYDGTNAAAVVDLLTEQYSIDPNSYMVGDETDGVLTVITTDRDLWGDVHVNEGDHVAAGVSGIQIIADASFTARYVLLT